MLSILINTHLLMAAKEFNIKKYLYSSSACVYAADKQTETEIIALKETDAYPAMPEDGYGWEKLVKGCVSISKRTLECKSESFDFITFMVLMAPGEEDVKKRLPLCRKK